MTAITSTIIINVATDTEYQPLIGDWSIENVVANYAAHIPGLAGMASEEQVEGTVKKIFFKPKTGSKGVLTA